MVDMSIDREMDRFGCVCFLFIAKQEKKRRGSYLKWESFIERMDSSVSHLTPQSLTHGWLPLEAGHVDNWPVAQVMCA